MDLTRRSLFTGGAALGTAGLLAACGGTSSSSSSDNPELTLLTPDYSQADRKTQLESVLDTYRSEAGTGVAVDYTDWSKLNEKITASIGGGVLSDLIMTGVGWVEPFAMKSVYAEASPDVFDGLEFTQGVVSTAQYEGKNFAVPLYADTRYLVANRAMFDEAGVDIPTSFEELREAAKELTAGEGAGKQWGIAIAGPDPRHLLVQFMGANDITMFDETGLTPQFTDQRMIDSLQIMLDMMSDGSTSWDLRAAEGGIHPFVDKKCAMSIATVSTWKDWDAVDPALLTEEQTELFLPENTQKSMFLGGTLLSRSANSKNPEQADALMAYLAQPEQMGALSAAVNKVPATAEALATQPDLAADRSIAYGSENLDHAVSEGGSPAWMELRGELNGILEPAFLGRATAEEVLEKAQQTAEDAISRL